MCLLLLCGWGEQMGLAVYPRASFAWEWKALLRVLAPQMCRRRAELGDAPSAFPEGRFAEGGLRGWLAFAACGGLT